MAKKILKSYQDLKNHEGRELGISDYLVIDQNRINLFAEATGDFQWIHTDHKKAAAESPFKSTIAHGYLTVSLISSLLSGILEVQNTKMTVNYGIENLRFNCPVLTGSRVRLKALLKEVRDLRGICRVRIDVTLEIRGETKPAFTGTIVLLYHFNSSKV